MHASMETTLNARKQLLIVHQLVNDFYENALNFSCMKFIKVLKNHSQINYLMRLILYRADSFLNIYI